MTRKPIWAIAGAVVAGMAIVGCENNRPFFDGLRGYSSTGYPAGGYAQNGVYYRQQGTVVVSKPAPSSVQSVEQMSASQMVNSPSIANGPTPMLTLTIPAMKIQIPVHGLFTAGQTTSTSAPMLEAPPAAPPAPVAIPEPVHAPAAPAPATQSSTSNCHPTSTVTATSCGTACTSPSTCTTCPAPANPPTATPVMVMPAQVQSTMPVQTVTATVQYMPASPRATHSDETVVPPPPVWPKSTADAEDAVPPPPPIHRNSASSGVPVTLEHNGTNFR